MAGESVAVVGYGNLGRSMALNLRDSGLEVVVGNVDDDYRTHALRDGFEVFDIGAAVRRASVAFVLLPDEVIGDVFARSVAPSIERGDAVCFASGYALAYGQVAAPEGIDVLLLAPRMLGDEVRHSFVDGSGFLSYVSVEVDASGKAESRLLGLAAASGSLRRGAMRLSARDEAALDLFIEQSVGPLLGAAIQTAFKVGAEDGIPPEALVLEMYMSGEMARTFSSFSDVGFYRSVNLHGLTAQFGGLLRTLDLDVGEIEARFRHMLEHIRSGGFAERFQQERDDGYPTLKMIEGITSGEDPISEAEDRVRKGLS